MAKANNTLTPREKEIKKLLDRGMTPGEVADTLGVGENTIYQARSRMRKKAGEKTTRRRGGAKRADEGTRVRAQAARAAGTRQRKSAAKPAVSASPAPSSAAANTISEPTTTPLQAIRNRRLKIKSLVTTTEHEVAEAERVLKTAREKHEKAVGKHSDELAQLDAAEAALTGATPKRKRTAPRKQTNGASAAPAPAQEAPAAPVAAEAPTEAPASEPAVRDDNGGQPVEEERPGVPVDPEFAQHEDAFAAE